MYIDSTGHAYYRSTSQMHSRAPFLLLVQPESGKGSEPVRAFVRKVAMAQCGHFMMGSARIHGHTVTVSGNFGGDGLPCSVPDTLYEKAIPVPEDIAAAFWKIDDWGGTGGEHKATVRNWARSFYYGGKN